MAYRIMLAGGGTGGHVFPLVAVAEQLQSLAQQQNISLELEMIGDGALLLQAAQELHIKCRTIKSPKWRRYLSIYNFTDVIKIPVSFFQSLYHLWRFMPDMMFAKGGYSSFFPLLVATLYRIPIVIHESDSIPGTVNTLFGKIARSVFVAFPSASTYFPTEKTAVTGNPIRAAILAGRNIGREQALQYFNLNGTTPVVFVTGASQGSQTINDIILASLVQLTSLFQIIHQTGTNNYQTVRDETAKEIKEGETTYGSTIKDHYRAYAFLDQNQMAYAYAAADVIIARAGSQVFEFAAFGKPSIIIPLEHAAANHQRANAETLSRFGFRVLEEQNLTPHILINEINRAYTERAVRSEAMRQFGRDDAASVIATSLLTLVINA